MPTRLKINLGEFSMPANAEGRRKIGIIEDGARLSNLILDL
jgi:hypothetical protein